MKDIRRRKTTFFKSIILVLMLAFTSLKNYALPGDTIRVDSSRFKIGVLPSFYYTPETHLAMGGIVYTFFKVGKVDTTTRKSNSQSYVSYTSNNQFLFENDYQIWLKKNKFYLTGSADYRAFSEYFYGLGNNTEVNDKTFSSFHIFRFRTKALTQIYRNVYGGVIIHNEFLYNQKAQLVSKDSNNIVYGNNGYNANGVGEVVILDKRNNPLNPSSGMYIETSFSDFKNIIPNKNGFTSFELDARKYATIKKIIWNVNLIYSSFNGNVPYRMLPSIGGSKYLRGYYRGRFRDKNLIIIQQEFRLHVYKMFGIAAFGGVGQVAASFSHHKHEKIHYNYGAGLRIRVNKKENANLRIDYGMTKDSNGLYVVFSEAF